MMSAAVTTVKAHWDRYEKDFYAVVANGDQQWASITQNRPAKWQKTSEVHSTFKERIELKKYLMEEYNAMLMEQKQLWFKL